MAVSTVRPASHQFARFIFERIESLWSEAVVEPEYRQAMRAALAPAKSSPSSRPVGFNGLPLIALPAWSCEAVGGNWQQAELVAAAWGLLYSAAHLLDAVEDSQADAGLQPTPSQGATINVATGLISSATLALNALEDSEARSETAREVRGRFHGAVLTMCGGQHSDLTRLEPTLEQCWQVAEAKSGAFFALACWAGARLACSDATQTDLFGQFGQNLGTVIQIRDDLSGLTPVAGEPSDLSSAGSWTLPAAYAMSVGSDDERDQLRRLLQAAPSDATALAEARRRMIECGAVLYLTVEVERRRRQAEAALTAASQSGRARDELLALLREVCTVRNA
ncbi:MAG: polyprenyl synthetase family protein [Anaerolineales bacterium]|nr:polyprenyl synthetase family protein [Anaerolineales bacterium]